ncbi:hypothetical protein KIW84_035802 [Lathyrus oleraceus]|uniref:Reverse transcriptase RNase H-like domain-containing protein n=1 Tax=Pisum sativum TaxID=3888 RepID=A0A9D5B658_PEA|nr:hypothetical protein KIW84_035802 [Pisum sativum]
MYLTVLDDSMGFVLGQQDESGKKEYAIYYLSKKFTDYESRYSTLEKTCYALAWATKSLRQYMLNHTTWLISKMDPIKAQKAIKGSILEDHLVHQPIEDYQSVQYDFPDEEILYLKMKYCDEPTLDEGPEPARLTFKCTNNMAEYEACIMGLEECIDLSVALREKPAGKQEQQSRHRALFIPKEGKETLRVNLEKAWSRDQREWDRESVMRREGISTPTHPSYSTGSMHNRKENGC